MEDHYVVLGVTRDATKKEIKEAYRRLAVKFHPDKHALSSESDRRRAALRFNQLSDAYDVLADDRKRADYNIRRSHRSPGGAESCGYGYGYGYSYEHRTSYGGGSGFRPGSGSASVGGGFVSRVESVVRFLTTRAFLLNAAFAGALLGGVVLIDKGGEGLWKMQNSGKSFEEAVESIERSKPHKDKT